MATNRFRNIIPVRSNYIPQQFVPNFEKYAGLLQNQQQAYDQVQSVRDLVPKHLKVDRGDVEAYREQVSGLVDNLADIYSTQGVSAGNRAQKEVLRNVRRDWQPGGKAYGFQQNYSAYQDYVKQLDEMHKSGKISSDKRNALASKSMELFGKSYGDQDEFKEFSGVAAAEDVDLAKQADELAKGWAENKIRTKEYTIKNGSYFDMRTQEYVDPQEIYNAIMPQLIANPKNSAYFNQAALLSNSGLTGKEFAQGLSSSAAEFAANKYGYTKDSSQYLSNWLLREQIKFQNKKKLKEMDMPEVSSETITYTVNTGLTPLDISSDGKIKTGEYKGIIEGGVGPSGRGPLVIPKSKKYEQLAMEDFAKSEIGMTKYPGLLEMINMPQFQRRHFDDGRVESDEDYNKRVESAWKSKVDALSTAAGEFIRFDDLQQERTSKQVFGTEEKPGTIVHKPIWIKTPGRPPEKINYERLLEMTGLKTVDELNKKSNILGTLKADNNIHPSGYEAVIADKKGKNTYSVIIGNTSIQEANYNKPIYDLTRILHDGRIVETGVTNWQPAENLPSKQLRARAVESWNPDGTFGGRTARLFEVEPAEGYVYAGEDEDGSILMMNLETKEVSNDMSLYTEVPSDVTLSEIVLAHRNLNKLTQKETDKRLK